MSRCDATGSVEGQYEPGSDGRVLANRLGITDPDEMDDTELSLLTELYPEVLGSVNARQRIRVADIREWHRRWLGNVYAWAGRYRTVTMSKGGFPFPPGLEVPRLMDGLDRDVLSVHTPCAGMSEDQLTEAIAIVHVKLTWIHPFRDGNGRLSRLVADVMARQAGRHTLDYTVWNAAGADYVGAVHQGMRGDRKRLANLVRRALRGADET